MSSPTIGSTLKPTMKPSVKPKLKGVDTPLDWQAWFTLALVLLGGLTLAKNKAPADFVFLLVIAILTLAQIITVGQAVAGFASTGMLTVAILMVVTAGITNTGALGYFMARILGTPKTAQQAIIRLLLPVGFLSSFINDTPVFLMFMPIIQTWAPKIGIDARLLWVPASFTALLGGTVTLIGTSTNIVLYGEIQKKYPQYPINLFDLSPVGVPVLLFGWIYIFIFTYRLLPSFNRLGEKGGIKQNIDAPTNAISGFKLGDLTLSAAVRSGSPVIGESIEGAGLRALQDLFLVAVTRGNLTVHSVEPDFVLESGDVLLLSGNVEKFVTICKEKHLELIPDDDGEQEASLMEEGQLVSSYPIAPVLEGHVTSALVIEGSELVGRTPKDIGFRAAFDSSILSIQRAGESVKTPIGQTTIGVGDILVLLTGAKFNPNAQNITKNLKILQANDKTSAEYIVSAEVLAKARVKLARSLVGLTIDDAGLRNLPGAFLIALTKANTKEIIRAVSPKTVLEVGDICWFTGKNDAIAVVRRIPGLQLTADSQSRKVPTTSEKRRLVEVAISPRSPMIGSTVREVQFRTRFGAAVVAIRRGVGSDNLLQDISNIKLQSGDVLMLDAAPEFASRFQQDENFLVVSELSKSAPPQFGKFYIAIFCMITIFTVFVASSTRISLVPLGICASAILLFFRVLTPQQARAAVDWEVLVTIAAAGGLSSALENTGLANAIANAFIQASIRTNTGEAGILSAMYIGTMLISLVVANNAAALIMFTIGSSAIDQYGVDPYKMFFILMLAASASFAIPYGYQTNIMCLSLGPYTFGEFARFGVPLQIYLVPISILLTAYMEYWWIGFSLSIVLTIICIVVLSLRGNTLVRDENFQVKPENNAPSSSSNKKKRLSEALGNSGSFFGIAKQ